MKVSVKKAGACRKTVAIEVPPEVIAEERAETLKVYAQHARIPGFRKGKAPAHVVASKYVKEIDQDLKERILPKFYQEAIQAEDLKVVNVIDATEVDPLRDLRRHLRSRLTWFLSLNCLNMSKFQ